MAPGFQSTTGWQEGHREGPPEASCPRHGSQEASVKGGATAGDTPFQVSQSGTKMCLSGGLVEKQTEYKVYV